VEFGKKFPTIGFDINKARVAELASGKDHTLECSAEELASAKLLTFSSSLNVKGLRLNGEEMASNDFNEAQRADSTNSTSLSGRLNDLSDCNVFIVTVPTPVDSSNRPDLSPLIKASETIGKVIKNGDVVIYESTVYPGATEEDCIPVIERVSGLKYICADDRRRTTDNREPITDNCKKAEGFFAGYSPERINPGDKQRRLTNIVKITSGSTPEIADFVDALYRSILTVETHKAPSIKVAEAAKVIENTQRDVNIALMNELAMIFSRMGIDTIDVLEAAGSKWNFLPFRPGLVGGHCIGVDPYYLSFKAQQAGYYPELISAQRRVNDKMGQFVTDEVIKLMLKKKITVNGAKVLILGITFKENCPDVRNTRVVDIVHAFVEYGCNVDIYDPWASSDEVQHEYGIAIESKARNLKSRVGASGGYAAVVLAVAHNEFKEMSETAIKALCADSCVIYDIKNVLPRDWADARL
jgi:UDP-N-acetyl-D-galactosamine dehydrogenase